MAIDKNHYYYTDFMRDLQKVDPVLYEQEVAAKKIEEEKLKELNALLKQRAERCSKILKDNFDKFKPHLRPCHKKEGRFKFEGDDISFGHYWEMR